MQNTSRPVARKAGVTQGALYGHFRSKAEAFEAAVVAGLRELRGGIGALRAEHGENWVSAFPAFYMGTSGRATSQRRYLALAYRPAWSARSGCPLGLRPRIGDVVQAITDGWVGGVEDGWRTRAQALLSLLAGASLWRAP